MLQLLGFIIDCPDPMRLAAFYSEVTGRSVIEGMARTKFLSWPIEDVNTVLIKTTDVPALLKEASAKRSRSSARSRVGRTER